MYYLSILTSQRFMDQIIISNLQLMVILVCIPGSEQRSKCMLLLLKKNDRFKWLAKTRLYNLFNNLFQELVKSFCK